MPEIAAWFGATRGGWIEHRSPRNPAGAYVLEGLGGHDADRSVGLQGSGGPQGSGSRGRQLGAASRGHERGERTEGREKSAMWGRGVSECVRRGGGRAAPTEGPGGAVREGGATHAAERGVRGWAGAVRCECGP